MGNVVRASIKLSFSRGGVSNIGVTGLPGFYPLPLHNVIPLFHAGTPLALLRRGVLCHLNTDHPSALPVLLLSLRRHPNRRPPLLERAMTRFSIDLHPTPLLYKSTSCRCSRFDTSSQPTCSPPRTRTRLSTSNLGPIEFSYASSPSSPFFPSSLLFSSYFFSSRLDLFKIPPTESDTGINRRIDD